MKFLRFVFFLVLVPAVIAGQGRMEVPVQLAPAVTPTITGPDFACEGSTNNYYSTDPGQADYIWTIAPELSGTITSGPGTQTIQVTWHAGIPAERTISVRYLGSTEATKNVTVSPGLPVSVTIVASANPVCAGTQVLFTATPVNGGTTPAYQWQVNGINVGSATNQTYTYIPANNNMVSCVVTSSEVCAMGNPAFSAPIVMTVSPLLPANIVITASSNPSCTGEPVNFTSTIFNGGSSPGYQWKVNGNVSTGATNATFSHTPVNNDKITCVLQSNASCVTSNPATSNEISMTVTPNLPVSVTIAASENPTCTGTQVSFLATPVNAGTSPVYQWFVNGSINGTSSPVFSYTPANGDVVSCVLVSNAGCATGSPATSNLVTMSVSQFLPASISIEASANPSCNGVPVTFTATPVNGGAVPTFQWFVNGSTVGTNSQVYSYTPNSGNIVTCVMTSSVLCATGSPATSNAIVMTVSATGQPGVTISASNNPSCAGTMVTLTAMPVNGGISPGFQWKVNGGNVGTNSSTLSYLPVNGDQVTCTITSNSLCSFGTVVSSNIIVLSVTPVQTVGITVTGPSGPVCQGNQVTFTALTSNGGTNPQYQWQVNEVNAGTSSTSYTYQPVDNDVVTCILTSNVLCSVGNPAISSPVTVSVSESLPAAVTISASSNPGCSAVPVVFTATPENGGTNPSYQWYVNDISMLNATNQTYSYSYTSGYNVKCVVTSNNGCPATNIATSNVISMSINPSLTASISIVASSQPACQNIFVTFTATAVNAGTDPVYQWSVNNTNVGINLPAYSYVPAPGDLVKCQMTSSNPCVAVPVVMSNTITMTVSPVVTPSITITPNSNPICPGTQVIINSSITNGGINPDYQWYLNSAPTGQNNPSYTFNPQNGDRVLCKLTSKLSCIATNPVTSAEVIMATNSPLPGAITISASQNPFCEGSSVTFYSVIVNGGTAPEYLWKVNGINAGTGTSLTYSPDDGHFVTCTMTSNLTCTLGPVTSNPILMTVNHNIPASISITASQNPVCTGAQVTFSSTINNGGTLPAYQWRVNDLDISGETLATYTYTPVNNDQVSCRLTSNLLCVSGNQVVSAPVVMNVSNGLPASVIITTATNPFCQGTEVTFTATPSNGGLVPVYEWKVNGVLSGTNSPVFTYFAAGNDNVTCDLTSNSTCLSGTNPVTSNGIVLTESTSLPISVSVTPSVNPACQGTSVTFTAIPSNGGKVPQFQWKVNANNILYATNSTYTFVPVNGSIVTCELTSDLTCATGNPALSDPVVMSITPTVFPSVSIAPSENPVCIGTPVTFTATPVNGGPSPGYIWRKNGLIVSEATNSVYNYTPVNYDAITCQLTSDMECNSGIPVISNQVAMVVNPEKLVGAVISTPSLTFCAGNPVTFTATAINGGTAPLFQWQVNGINGQGESTNSTYTFIPGNGAVVTCVVTSNLSCITNNPATSNSLLMIAGTDLVAGITITADPNTVICPGTKVYYEATTVNGGGAPYYQWKRNGDNVGPNLYRYECFPENGDVISCVLTSSLTGCVVNPVVMSNEIIQLVYPASYVTVVISTETNPACAGNDVCFFADVTNGGDFARYRWMKNGTTLSSEINNPTYCYENLVDGDIIKCAVNSTANCPSPTTCNSNTITMAILPISEAEVSITASANPVCEGTLVTYTANPVNGGTAPEYEWKVNGAAAPGSSNSPVYEYAPVHTDVVSSQMTSNAFCVSTNVASSNPVPMIVSSFITADITIEALQNPVCQGSQVTFVATPVHGGPAPVFQWKVNGANQGDNSPVFTYIPADGDAVTCIMTSNEACIAGNPAQSNSITLSVLPTFPVSISIAPTTTPPCQGEAITYIATAVNGGTNPNYQWLVNGMMVGNNEPTYTYVPATGDAVACHLTSDIGCTTSNPALSNEVIMNFPPYLAVGISITSTANPVCEGNELTFNAVGLNGGAAPLYQWKKNGVDIPGATNMSYTYIPENSDVITCQLSSLEICTTNNPALSNSITISVLPNKVPAVTITASVNPVCAGNLVTIKANPVNGGSLPLYNWFKNSIPLGISTSTYTYIPGDGDIVFCELVSSLSCATPATASSNTIVLQVEPFITPTISIVASPFPACDNQPVTLTATAPYTGENPVYLWIINGFQVGANNPEYTYIATSGDVVRCQLASDYSCATNPTVLSNEIIMEINPVVQPGIVIETSANPVCGGETVTYTAAATNGGANPEYLWKINGIEQPGNSATLSYVPIDNDVITCLMTSDETCVTTPQALSNEIEMIVAASFDVSVEIATLDNPSCVGTEVTFTATPHYGGNSPAYQWFVNGDPQTGATSATYIYLPTNGDVVHCVMTSQFSCGTPNPAISNIEIMEVIGVPVSITITADPVDPVCEGTEVTYTGFPLNGGSMPTYQWSVNGVLMPGTNNPVFVYAPQDSDQITCTLNSNAACVLGNTVTSEPIIASVNEILPVSVTISDDAGGIACAGTLVTFTAVGVNGGTMPGYLWNINGFTVLGVNSPTYSYNPEDGDIITSIFFSNATCATGSPAVSNPIVMTVNPSLPVSVTISESANNICEGTGVLFSALSVNGGATATYRWKVNGLVAQESTETTFTYLPVNNDEVTCELNSSETCATGNPAVSNTVTMTVHPVLPVSVSVVVSENPVCAGTEALFTAMAVNGGTTAAYQWMLGGSDIAGETNATYSYFPANNEVITCRLTSGEVCTTGNPAVSDPVTMIVNPLLPVSVTITASENPVCAGTTVSYSAVAGNGGTGGMYRWMVDGIVAQESTETTFSYIPVNNDEVTCELNSSEICTTGNPAVSNSVTMTVHPVLPVSVSVTVSENPVCTGTEVTFTATAVNGGTAAAYQWVNGGTDITGETNSTYSYTPANNDVITCRHTSGEVCTTGNPAVSDPVTMTVNPLLPVSATITASENPVCAGIPVTFTAAAVNGGTGGIYRWLVDGLVAQESTEANFSYIPVNNDVITCELNSSEICTTGNPAVSNTLTMTVHPLLAVSVSVTVSENPVCAGTEVFFTATEVNGGTMAAYQWMLDGADITGATNSIYSYTPLNNEVITCRLASGEACTTGNPAVSDPVTMIVNPLLPVSVTITASENPVCAGTLVLYTAIPANGGTGGMYRWTVDGLVAQESTEATFSNIPVNNNEVTCELNSTEICTTGNPAVSNMVLMTVHPVLPVSVSVSVSGNPVCAGTEVTFTATAVNGGTTVAYQWMLGGTDIPGETNSAYSYTPANNEVITCRLTSGEACTTGNPAVSSPVTMTVNPQLPVSVTITASENPVCAGIPVTFTAVPENGGTGGMYRWLVDGIVMQESSEATFIYIPINSCEVICELNSTEICTTGNPTLSNPVTVVLEPLFPVSVTISANPSVPVCSGMPVTYTATAVNGGTNPAFEWLVNGAIVAINTDTFTFAPEPDDLINCRVTSDLFCTSGNPAEASVTASVGVSPDVTFSPCNDIVTAINAKPFKLRGGLPLGGVYSGAGVNPATAVFDPSVAGIGLHTLYYTCTTSGMCTGSDDISVTVLPETIVDCGNLPIIDPRDGRSYPTVKIGNQCWMSQNLNFGTIKPVAASQTDNCLDEKYCLYDSETNCNQYGGLYQWDELMRHDPAMEGQGLCPPGWHVPTNADWGMLFNLLGGQSTAGALMKSQATGSFNAITGGVLYQSGNWSFTGPEFSATIFGTSESAGPGKIRTHGLNNEVISVSDYLSGRENAFSVRCLFDEPVN